MDARLAIDSTVLLLYFALIIAVTAATYFGAPGEGFTFRNYTYLQLALGTILARILVSYIFIKPYYDYKVYSIYEYLTARFGVPTKNAGSAVFIITRLLASGARLYFAAIALALAYEMISGTRPNQTQTLVIYVSACIAIVILTAIYTTLGGIKAVIWTDHHRPRSSKARLAKNRRHVCDRLHHLRRPFRLHLHHHGYPRH